MRKQLLLSGLLVLFGVIAIASGVLAENVILATTADGEQVALHSVGTWEYLPIPADQDWSLVVQFVSFTSEYFEEDYSRDEEPYREHVKLHFRFRNLGSKPIAAIALKAHYQDAFGDVIYEMDEFKWSLPMAAGGLSNPGRYLLAEKNVQNAFEPLRGPVMGGSLHVTITLTRIALEDGTVLSFDNDIWRGPSWLEESTSLPKRGIRLVLEAQGVEEMTVKQRDDTLNRVVAILRNRVDQYGLTNVEIKRIETDRIFVNYYPGAKNPTEVRALIGQTAMLEFHKVIQAGTSPNFDLVPSSSAQEVLYNRDGIPYIVETEPLLTGAALSDALVRTSQSMQNAGSLYIAMTFNQEGAQQFVEALRKLKGDDPDTVQNEGDLLAVVLDNVIYSAPRITQSIKDAAAKGWRNVQSTTTISGKFTKEEATRIAIVLRAGALPVAVKVVAENTVGEE